MSLILLQMDERLYDLLTYNMASATVPESVYYHMMSLSSMRIGLIMIIRQIILGIGCGALAECNSHFTKEAIATS